LAGEVVQRVIDHVRANLSEPLSLEVLAEVAGLSRFHFARQFRVSTGESPMGYVLRARMERARVLLSRPEHPTIAHIASSLGFADQSHFTRTFRRFFGLTPKTFASLAGTPASGGPEPEVEALLAVG
jgi:AraC family transcriptional regulator